MKYLKMRKIGKIKKLIIGLIILGIISVYYFYYERKLKIKKLSKTLKSDNEKVICFIMTSEKTFIERSVTVWETWAHKCDKTVFACNCQNFTKNLNSNNRNASLGNIEFERVSSIPIMQLNVVEHYDSMAEKVILILEKMYKNYIDQFKWFFLVDDDTYVFVENLMTFIGKLNYTEPYTYGFNFNNKGLVESGYHSGGGKINASMF